MVAALATSALRPGTARHCDAHSPAICLQILVRCHQLNRLRPREEEPWVLLRQRIRAPLDTKHRSFIFDPDLQDHYDWYDYSLKMEARMCLWKPWDSDAMSASALPQGPPGSSLFHGLPSSLGGLVCGRLMEYRQALVFVVGNPVINEWKVLPEAPSRQIIRPPYLSYALVRSSGSGYKLLCFEELYGDEVESLVQYDSEQETWRKGPGFRFDDAPASKQDDAQALLEASIFCLSKRRGWLAAYEANSMMWYCVAVPSPTGFFREAVFKHEKLGLILMGALFLNFEQLFGFGVWELDLKKRAWKLVSRVDAGDVLGQGGDPDTDFDVKSQLVGDWFLFSCWFKDTTFGHSFPPIAYHVPTRQWRSSSSYTTTTTTDFECCYAFQPSLTERPFK